MTLENLKKLRCRKSCKGVGLCRGGDSQKKDLQKKQFEMKRGRGAGGAFLGQVGKGLWAAYKVSKGKGRGRRQGPRYSALYNAQFAHRRGKRGSSKAENQLRGSSGKKTSIKMNVT